MNKMERFLAGRSMASFPLSDVPGVGDTTLTRLTDFNIDTTEQLIACFLLLGPRDGDQNDNGGRHERRFKQFLSRLEIEGNVASSLHNALHKKTTEMFGPAAPECNHSEGGVDEIMKTMADMLLERDSSLSESEEHDGSSVDQVVVPPSF